MANRFLFDFIKGNRASALTIAITVGISSFLLALLACVFYNFWADDAAQLMASQADLDAMLGEVTSPTAILYTSVVVLAAIVLVLVIRNAFAASMQSKVHQLGILSTVGATPKQLRSLLVKESLYLSAIPAIIGIGLGIAASAGFIGAVVNVGTDIGIESTTERMFRFNPLVLVLILILVFTTVIVSAGIPARHLSKIAPLDAVSGAIERGHARRKRPSLLARFFGIEGELAYSSMTQRRKTLRTASIAMGIAFLVLGVFLSFMTISRMSVEQTYYQRYGTQWDIVIESPTATSEDLEEIAGLLDDIINVSIVDASDNGMRLYVKSSEAIATHEAINNLEDTLSSTEAADAIIVDMAEDKRRANAIWDVYVLVVGGFCGILALIGIAAVVAQSIGMIVQRKREFARLRSIGLTPGGIRKMLGIEGLMTVLRPIGFSLPFIIVIAFLLLLAGGQSIFSFLVLFPYWVLLAYIAACLVLVMLSNLIGAKKINNYNLAETLKNDVYI